MDSKWIAIILTIVGFAATVLIQYGYNKKRFEVLEDKQREQGHQHGDHYKHSENIEIHWTSRERDALEKTMQELRTDIKFGLQSLAEVKAIILKSVNNHGK